jgi:hypothetical protein
MTSARVRALKNQLVTRGFADSKADGRNGSLARHRLMGFAVNLLGKQHAASTEIKYCWRDLSLSQAC